jgi:chorismate mutase
MVNPSEISGVSQRDDESLNEIREDLDEIDSEILDIIAQRTYYADTLAKAKPELGLPILDEEREEEILKKAEKSAERYSIDSNITVAIFRMLIELNKIEQRKGREEMAIANSEINKNIKYSREDSDDISDINADLDDMREELDRIDDEMLDIIARRTYFADRLAKVKSGMGLPIQDEDRETKVLRRAEKEAENYNIDPNIINAIFRMLIELNKIEQRKYR